MQHTEDAGYYSTACMRRDDDACERVTLRRMVCACPCHDLPTAYLSGPTLDVPNRNRDAFSAAADTLRTAGFQVVDPSQADPSMTPTDHMRAALADLLVNADLLVSLEDWESSPQAQVERGVAIAAGLTVVEVDDAVALEIARSQWLEARQ